MHLPGNLWEYTACRVALLLPYFATKRNSVPYHFGTLNRECS